MKVAVFHPGTQHSWQTALALQQLEQLAWYGTSIFYQPDRFPYRLERWLPGPVGRRVHAEFRRFSHPALDPTLVYTGGVAEWVERVASRAGFRKAARQIDAWGNKRFVRQIAGRILSDDEFAMWGYNGSSESSFELARKNGRACVLDRTIGDFRIYNAEMARIADRYGEWFLPVEREISISQIAQDQREYELADRIVVGSPYAAETIRATCGNPAIERKVQVLNYCFDEGLFANLPAPQPVNRATPVRFLFMGLANPRKGIQHVLEAIAQLPPGSAELTIVGAMRVPSEIFARYADRVTYRPTVARADVPAIMLAHDVLLLPSYFEGAGIVLYEALAAGCGLIHSDRCAQAATSDTGLILPEVSTDALLAAMEAVIRDRSQLRHWRAHAQAEAQNYTFTRYRDGVRKVIEELGN